jgi:hypothetical protein
MLEVCGYLGGVEIVGIDLPHSTKLLEPGVQARHWPVLSDLAL